MQTTSGWSLQLALWTVSWTINDHYLFSLSLSQRKFFSPNSFKLCFCLLHIYRPPNWNMFKLPPPSRDFNEQMGGRSLGDMSIKASPGMSQCEARQSRSSALPWLTLNLCNVAKGFLKSCFHNILSYLPKDRLARRTAYKILIFCCYFDSIGLKCFSVLFSQLWSCSILTGWLTYE